MRNLSKIAFIFLFSTISFQAGLLWAADTILKKAASTSRNASDYTSNPNVGDAARAERDIARATAPKKVSGTGFTPVLEGNSLPHETVTPDPLPANVAVSGDQCPQLYRCVVPHGSMLLATCFAKTGAPGESSVCSDVQPKCLELDGVRRSGGTLSQADDAFFDHNCKAN